MTWLFHLAISCCYKLTVLTLLPWKSICFLLLCFAFGFPLWFLFFRDSSLKLSYLHAIIDPLNLTNTPPLQEHSNCSSESNCPAKTATDTTRSTATHNPSVVSTLNTKPLVLEKRRFHESFTKAKPGSIEIQAVPSRDPASKVTLQGLLEPQNKNGTQEQDPGPVDLDDASLPVSYV